MITVHVIFNAHIDPIWLWPWQSGLDEVLATCASACDRLDRHPDVVFTRGEAWAYSQVEKIDPALFARIRAHIEAGRWEIAGGWWLQPDCNAPSGFAMERQITIGKRYFESRFGRFPRYGYNVDSFGHAATLPGLMAAAGQDAYVMMRPGQHEMKLPAGLFRWRGYENGPEVVTFRICEAYTVAQITDDHVKASLAHLPEGIEHTMMFAGFGDHGGGPTERQIQWVRDHQDSFPGVRLEFSSPSRFFEAVWPEREKLPEVVGELQMHAVGCYSAYRPIKTALRSAEHLTRQAECLAQHHPQAAPPDGDAQIQEAWERVCFNHFHDTLGGTCIPSAYPQPLAQLGYAANVADDFLQTSVRRINLDLPPDPLQRLVIYNASDTPFAGMAEHTPWLEWSAWGEKWRVLDESGAEVPHQALAGEALAGSPVNLLFPLTVAPGQRRVLRIDTQGRAPIKSSAWAEGDTLRSDSLHVDPHELAFGDLVLPLPTLKLYDDRSDTWSHDIDRFAEDEIESAQFATAVTIDNGPLMASTIAHGTIGRSDLTAEWRLHAAGYAELRLTVEWLEQHKLLKLVLPLPKSATGRVDGILGGWLARPLDGREYPMQNGVILEFDSQRLGIAAPDVYAVDCTPERARFTLLRSPLMAHHAPHGGEHPRRQFSDHGRHEFRFRFYTGDASRENSIGNIANQMQRPLVICDLTRGMPMRRHEM